MTAPPPKIKNHARARAILRFNLDLTPEDEQEILRLIRTGGALFVEESERFTKKKRLEKRYIYDVVFRNRYIRVVVDRKYTAIITILPYKTKVEEDA
jgi:hypothetical protein